MVRIPDSIFAPYQAKNYPYQYAAEVFVPRIAGGIPLDPKVLEWHLKSKLTDDRGLLIVEAIRDLVMDGLTADEAVVQFASTKGVCGFYNDDDGLYIPGYYIKKAIVEFVNIAVAADKLPGGKAWGTTKKGQEFFREHVFVKEDKLHFGAYEPTGIHQHFPLNKRTKERGIAYHQYIENATLTFTVESDWEFSDEQWAAIWTTGERNGIGACRSVGMDGSFGTFRMTQWARI